MGPDQRDLQGAVAIVTGAGEGIGRSCALALARDGADVALAARRPDVLARLADEVHALGRRALVVPTDVGDHTACQALVDTTVAALGRLDVVVNVAAASDEHTTIEQTDLDVFRRAFEVNVLGTLAVSRAALPALRAAGGGAIVQISTLSARTSPPKQAPYTSTKSALETASSTLAKEVGRDGVRVNVVVPGWVTGPHLDALFARIASRSGRSVESVFDEIAATTALGRIPSPDDVAEAVLFLASGRSAAITGATLDVNAGAWMSR